MESLDGFWNCAPSKWPQSSPTSWAFHCNSLLSPSASMKPPTFQSPRKIKWPLNGSDPVVVTLTIMKSFERLIMAHICTSLPDQQMSVCQNWSKLFITLTLNMVLLRVVCSVFTCSSLSALTTLWSKYNANPIFKFTDDTPLVSWINNNNETKYRQRSCTLCHGVRTTF